MITLLSKIFKTNSQSDEKQRGLYGMICGVAGIILNLILFGFKFLAGTISNSIAITADSFNNLSDAGSSIITLIGFRLASHKPDSSHPYGHGRMEYLAEFIVAALILAMGLSLVKDSVIKIIKPEETIFQPLIVIILLVSILIKLYMAFYNKKIGKRINSGTLLAVATDSISDCGATAAVLVFTLINHYTSYNIDGIGGLLVGIIITIAGINAAKEAMNPLLGQAPDKEFVEQIKKITLSFDENIHGMHDLIVHDYGPGRRFVSLHAEVPAEGDILKLHDIIDNLEHTLLTELGCLSVVHMDPIITKDPRVNELKEKTQTAVKDIDPGFIIHDFRVVFGDTHTNLLFDVLVPMDYPSEDSRIKQDIFNTVKKQLGEKYFTVTDIDRDYTNLNN